MAKLITVQLISTQRNKGKGIESDPIRNVQQFWTTDGKVLLSFDPETKILEGAEKFFEYLESI